MTKGAKAGKKAGGAARTTGGVQMLHAPTPRHYPVRIRDNYNFRNPVNYKQTMPVKVFDKRSKSVVDHPTQYKPTNFNDERGNQRGFNEPLMPETDQHWPWNTEIKAMAEPDKYYEPVISDTLLDKFNSFGEYKNSRKYDDFYPQLFKVPERVYPGRLAGTAYGSFDWWKSEPQYDWWNAAREICRVPPASGRGKVVGHFNGLGIHEGGIAPKSKTTGIRDCDSWEGKDIVHGYWPLTRKFVPPVPRFPLKRSNSSNGELMPSFGPFDPQNSMRRQVNQDFVVSEPRKRKNEGNMTPSSRSTAPSSRSQGSGRRERSAAF